MAVLWRVLAKDWLNPGPSSCEETVLTAIIPCHVKCHLKILLLILINGNYNSDHYAESLEDKRVLKAALCY